MSTCHVSLHSQGYNSPGKPRTVTRHPSHEPLTWDYS